MLRWGAPWHACMHGPYGSTLFNACARMGRPLAWPQGKRRAPHPSTHDAPTYLPCSPALDPPQAVCVGWRRRGEGSGLCNSPPFLVQGVPAHTCHPCRRRRHERQPQGLRAGGEPTPLRQAGYAPSHPPLQQPAGGQVVHLSSERGSQWSSEQHRLVLARWTGCRWTLGTCHLG